MPVDLRGQRVLISGVTGFIGAHLAHRLIEEDAEVLGISRGKMDPWRLTEVLSQIKLVQADLTESRRIISLIRGFSPHYVLHCAVARPEKRSDKTADLVEDNLAGVRNVLKGSESVHPQRCVVLGSSLEYEQKTGPMREIDRIHPDTEFGAAKAAATQFAQAFARQSNFPITILRLFSVYGPWENGDRLIPRAFLAALREGELALTAPGYRHDFVFVEDVVEACYACMGLTGIDNGEVYNVGSGEQWTNEEVVGLIERVTGEKIHVQQGTFPSREFDRESWLADIQKIKRELGWEPTSLLSGLEKTAAWFYANQHRYGE
jgi:nucleoside-diphosphate-sugar epimerase